MTSPIAAAGLVLDIAGGLTLASGFMFKHPKQRHAESEQAWGFSAKLDVSLAKQTADARVGGFLLSSGFALQLASNLGWQPTDSTSLAITPAVILSLVVMLVLFVPARRVIERHVVASRLQSFETLSEWRTALDAYGRAINRLRQEDETPAEFGQRILGETRWCKLTAGRELPPELTNV